MIGLKKVYGAGFLILSGCGEVLVHLIADNMWLIFYGILGSHFKSTKPSLKGRKHLNAFK